MPEGPEVECTRLALSPLTGKRIVSIKFTKNSQKYQKYKNKQQEVNDFKGQKLIKIERKGKFLIWVFEREKVILNHLGMSGKWILLKSEKQELPSHAKVLLNMEDLPHAVFDDTRNFGQFRVFNNYSSVSEYRPIKKMGINGLAKKFPIEEFLEKLNKKNYAEREIGAVLLDQKLVAGMGNIYKSESLALAEIRPMRLVKELSENEREFLGICISKTLHKALKSMGSTFQAFRTPDGQEGKAQNWHQVYGKERSFCSKCSNKITKLIQNGRSTFFCSKCQK